MIYKLIIFSIFNFSILIGQEDSIKRYKIEYIFETDSVLSYDLRSEFCGDTIKYTFKKKDTSNFFIKYELSKSEKSIINVNYNGKKHLTGMLHEYIGFPHVINILEYELGDTSLSYPNVIGFNSKNKLSQHIPIKQNTNNLPKSFTIEYYKSMEFAFQKGKVLFNNLDANSHLNEIIFDLYIKEYYATESVKNNLILRFKILDTD